MINKVFETNKLQLYSGLFETYNLSELKDIQKYLNKNSIDKLYSYYLLIKKNGSIIICKVSDLNHENIHTKLSFLKNTFKFMSNKDKKKIQIKILKLEQNEDNFKKIKELNNEFKKIEEQLYPEYSYKKLHEIHNKVFRYILYIFPAFIIVYTLMILEKLNLLGIPITYINVESLALFSNNIVKNMIIVISTIIGVISLMYLAQYIFSIVKEKYRFDKFADLCLLLTKSISIFIIVLFLIYIYFFDSKQDSLLGLAEISANSYIRITREPSLRTLTDEKNQVKTILLMGKDSTFIYYIPISTVKEVMKTIPNKICTKDSYIEQIIELLNLYKKDKVNSLYNRRHSIKNIRNIHFEEKPPGFNEVLCNEN